MKHLTTIMLLLLVMGSYAQKVTVLKAARQNWSGGIAGHAGTNYYFTLQFTGCKSKPAPDTLWIGQEPFALFPGSPGPQKMTATLTGDKGKYKLEITAGTSRDEYRWKNPGSEEKPKKMPLPKNYKGVALLSYSSKGKRRYYPIPGFITEYTPISYP